jgi:RNA polymerase sigma-70 factor (ECF subfamily)
MGRHPFEEHLPRLRRYALALMRDRMRADDLVQDTLERALRKFSLFRRSTDLRAWLFTIMHNVHVNQIRAAMAAARTQPDDAGGEPAHAPLDDAATARDISNALQHLAPEHREVILLVGLEQLSYAETARVLDVPIGTVMSRLTRARERLRALMSGETSSTLRRVK